jgi:hypothetical protein
MIAAKWGQRPAPGVMATNCGNATRADSVRMGNLSGVSAIRRSRPAAGRCACAMRVPLIRRQGVVDAGNVALHLA